MHALGNFNKRIIKALVQFSLECIGSIQTGFIYKNAESAAIKVRLATCRIGECKGTAAPTTQSAPRAPSWKPGCRPRALVVYFSDHALGGPAVGSVVVGARLYFFRHAVA